MEDVRYAPILAVLFIAMVILAFMPVLVLFFIFPKAVFSEAKVETEIINGLVTVSGLIFVFQPTFFKATRTRSPKLRLMVMAIFLVEVALFVITGYSYVSNTLSQGYLSTSTLFTAVGSLFFNASMTVFFVLADLAVMSFNNPS